MQFQYTLTTIRRTSSITVMSSKNESNTTPCDCSEVSSQLYNINFVVNNTDFFFLFLQLRIWHHRVRIPPHFQLVFITILIFLFFAAPHLVQSSSNPTTFSTRFHHHTTHKKSVSKYVIPTSHPNPNPNPNIQNSVRACAS